MNKINAFAKLIRLPGLGGLAIPPVIGALSVGIFDFYNLAIVFIIGALSAIYGFILNDYADIELDKLVKELHGKPLVNGSITRMQALSICVFCIFLAFFFIFYLWYGKVIDEYKFMAGICILLAGFLGSIYNLFGKKIIGSDFLVALSVAFVFLFGALSFAQPTLFTWIIFILTFNNLLHMNAVEGGIKDADHDYLMGVKNIALSSGVKVTEKSITIPSSFKFFAMGIRFFTAILVFVPVIFFNYSYPIWQIILLLAILSGVIILSFKLLSIKEFDRARIRRYIASQSFIRYSLVPVLLVSFIGIYTSVFLIIFPIIWYVLFAPLLGEKLLRPRM
ncbi:MAG: UbiA family prenyltransferase [Thermoplasmatota archaeon]